METVTGNSDDSDQISQYVTSVLDLYCLPLGAHWLSVRLGNEGLQV